MLRAPTDGRRRVLRRLLVAVTLLGVLAVAAAACVNLTLAGRLDRIEGAFAGLGERRADAPGETILMVGTRPGGTEDVAWLEGEQSVESVMLVEIDATGRSVLVETLPVAAADLIAVGSAPPSRTVALVESLAGRRVDHLIAVGWETFAELATDNRVDAAYRYGSPAAAQHDYLRLVMKGTLRAELRRQPLDLYRALRTTADGTAVDDEWSVLELDRLLVRLRNLRSRDITFSTRAG